MGGVPCNAIAKWDGSAWTALGQGISGAVLALAVAGTNLYAGGNFNMVGGIPATGVGKWDGAAWSTLGSALWVHALAVSGTNVFAAFGSSVAKWDGSSWVSLGSDLTAADPWASYTVRAFAASGANLYAGGDFITAGGTSANYIARWDGSSWSPLGSGLNSPVWALAISRNDLYVGGEFTIAGNKLSDNVARVVLDLPRLTSMGFTNRLFRLKVSGVTGQTVAIQSSTNLMDWSAIDTVVLGDAPTVFTDAQSGNVSRRFYRGQLLP
jgi:hypothetical protein